jgi:hypothetical protein
VSFGQTIYGPDFKPRLAHKDSRLQSALARPRKMDQRCRDRTARKEAPVTGDLHGARHDQTSDRTRAGADEALSRNGGFFTGYVLKCNVYCTSVELFEEVNEVIGVTFQGTSRRASSSTSPRGTAGSTSRSTASPPSDTLPVVFEASLRTTEFKTYLDTAKMLRPELEAVEGFVDSIRCRSLQPARWILSPPRCCCLAICGRAIPELSRKTIGGAGPVRKPPTNAKRCASSRAHCLQRACHRSNDTRIARRQQSESRKSRRD